jgi:hypothetical protein
MLSDNTRNDKGIPTTMGQSAYNHGSYIAYNTIIEFLSNNGW